MALSILVGGVERATYCQRFSTRRAVNTIGSGTFVFVDESASAWVPTEMDEVIVNVDGTQIFRGRILTTRVEWATAYIGARSTAQVVDLNDRANLELLNVPIASASLKSILTTIMSTFSAQGVTLAAGQATGPTLGDQEFAWSTVREALDHLATLSGYLWSIEDISGTITLEMWPIGARSSGLSLSQANGNVRSVQWAKDVTGYRNIQWLVYGPTQNNVPVEETWTNDGVNRNYPMSYQLNGGVAPNGITRSDTGESVPVLPGLEWSYNSALNRLEQTGGTPVANGATLTASYTVGFPQYVVRTDAAEVAARGRWMKKDVAETIVDFVAAGEYADALIRSNLPRPARLTVVTRATGADPGETCSVSAIAGLGLSSGTFLVEAVSAEYRPIRNATAHVEFTLELIGGSERQDGWQDFWADLIKGSGGGGGGVSGGVSGGSGSTGGGVGAMFLGGSRSRSLDGSNAVAPTGIAVADYVPVTLDSSRYPSGIVTVRCEVRSKAAGTTVTPKLVCLDTGATAGSGYATASTTWEAQTFAATLVSGVKRYALFLVASNATNEVMGIGYLE